MIQNRHSEAGNTRTIVLIGGTPLCLVGVAELVLTYAAITGGHSNVQVLKLLVESLTSADHAKVTLISDSEDAWYSGMSDSVASP